MLKSLFKKKETVDMTLYTLIVDNAMIKSLFLQITKLIIFDNKASIRYTNNSRYNFEVYLCSVIKSFLTVTFF